MNTLEDDIRAVLDSQANAMQVPEPHLSRSIPLTSIAAGGRADARHPDFDELVPVREINFAPKTSTAASGTRRRVLLAAAAVVAMIGTAGIALAINNRRSGDNPSQTPASATSVAPAATSPAMTTVQFVVTRANIPVAFTAPDDWIIDEGFAAHKGAGIGEVGLNITEIGNIYADGCEWKRVNPPVGPTVSDLAAAWSNVPGLAATPAVDTTVDGYAGKQVEFTVPDYDTGDCEGLSAGMPEFGLWSAPGDAFPGFWAQGPHQHTELQIVDVDGTRLVITTYYVPSASPQDRAALDEALASIQIGRSDGL